jgi:hypothetical protein
MIVNIRNISVNPPKQTDIKELKSKLDILKITQKHYGLKNNTKTTNRLKKASELTKSLEVYEWMIRSIIPSEGLIEIIGASGSYKSFLVLDMMFCMASGIDYHGYQVKPGTAIYVAGEGINGVKIRLRGLELHYCIQDYNLYILPTPSNLKVTSEIIKLANEIKEISSDVSMIIFDTLHRNSAGADENSANDWAEILNNIDRYLKPVSKVVGWVHHTGISETSSGRGRGTSSRYASIETQILIEKKDAKKAFMTNTKQKDAEEFGRLLFEFKNIETGLIDEDGISVFTLYPQRVEQSEDNTGKKSKLRKEHYDLEATLRLSIKSKGQPINEEIKQRDSILDGRMILISEWRQDALKVIVSSGDINEKKQYEAKTKAFIRNKKTLIDERKITEYANFVYIVSDCTFRNH